MEVSYCKQAEVRRRRALRDRRTATGVPAGSDLEYDADEVTMRRAMEGRREM
jgi:recombinational DNA repair protein RecR